MAFSGLVELRNGIGCGSWPKGRQKSPSRYAAGAKCRRLRHVSRARKTCPDRGYGTMQGVTISCPDRPIVYCGPERCRLRASPFTFGAVVYVRGRGATGFQARIELPPKSCFGDHVSVARLVSQLARAEGRERAPPVFRPVGSGLFSMLFFRLPIFCCRCSPGIW
jgi:hypothetical protein